MGAVLVGAGGTDPSFAGTQAIAQFNLAGGSAYSGAKVPVENTGGPGTRDAHWREAVFGTEVMTGFIIGAADRLSAITVGSMGDIGYTVSVTGAEAFTLPALAAVVRGAPPVALGNDRLRLPITVLDPQGRWRR